MPGSIYNDISPSLTSGNQLATYLNDFKDIVASGFIGATRPTNLQAGGYWIDNSLEGSPDFTWTVKVYTGSADVAIYQVNISTNTSSIAGASNLFTIEKTSADNVGAVLKFLKERIANNGQVLDGDIVGALQFFGSADDNSNPVVARFRVVSSDDMTSSAFGSYITFEATADNTASLVEMFRIQDGKIGIGLTSPTSIVHARGASGITSENRADDTVGALSVLRKQRVSSLGQVLSGDVIGTQSFRSTDDTGSSAEVASISVTAAETHTTTAQGSNWSLKVTPVGAITPSEIAKVESGKLETVVVLKMNPTETVSQDIATAATIASLSASKSAVVFTGATVTSVQGIDASGPTKNILLHNKSTAKITIKNEDAGATAANRISLPASKDITIDPGASLELFYYSSDSRWRLKSGSGSGGGAMDVSATQTLANAAVVTLIDVQRQRVKIKSTGGEATVTLPNGTLAAQEVFVQGDDSDNPCIIANSGNVASNGDTTFLKYVSKLYIWDTTETKWVMSGGY